MTLDGSAFRAALGATIRRRRLELGLTQAQLADSAGVHQSNVSRIETGDLAATLEVLADLAGALDLTLGQLVETAARRDTDTSTVRGAA